MDVIYGRLGDVKKGIPFQDRNKNERESYKTKNKSFKKIEKFRKIKN